MLTEAELYIQEIDKIQNGFNENPEILCGKGQLFLYLGKVDLAQSFFNKAIMFRPSLKSCINGIK